MNDVNQDWPLDQLRTELQSPDAAHEDRYGPAPDLNDAEAEALHAALSGGATDEPRLIGSAETLDEVDALLGTPSRIRPSFRSAVIRGARAGAQWNRDEDRSGLVAEVLASIDEVLADQATPVSNRPVVNDLRASVKAVQSGSMAPRDFAPEHLRDLETMFQVSPEEFVKAGAQIRLARAGGGALGIMGSLRETDNEAEAAQWLQVLNRARALSDTDDPALG